MLERFKPSCASGSAWGPNNVLYVTGHDAGEVYLLRVPAAGDVLEHVATLTAPIHGHAIATDPADPTRLFGISRLDLQMIEMKLPSR